MNGLCEFHSHFSDDNRQDASTTHTHIIYMLEKLNKKKQLKCRYIIWESTDGCCKQYRCGANYLSIISTNFNFIVDRMIGAPGHGKDGVNGINNIVKRYLMEKICMIGTLEVDDYKSKMNAKYSMVDIISCSLSKEYTHLCEDEIRINGVKSHSKSKKREVNAKVKKEFIIYNIRMMLKWWE